LRNLFRRQHRETGEDEENPAPLTSGPTNASPLPVTSHQNQSSENTSSYTGTQLQSSAIKDIKLTWKIESPGINDESAPNISLNLHGGSKDGELYSAALCGIVLQFGMLVFCGFSVYHPEFSQRFPKNGHPVQEYAYPIMATGTIILMIGMLICSAVVEHSTRETEYVLESTKTNPTCSKIISLSKMAWMFLKNMADDNQSQTGNTKQDVTEKPKVRILWLQKSRTVSDQVFDSFVLFGQYKDGPRDYILTSERSDAPSVVTAERPDESPRNSSNPASRNSDANPDPPTPRDPDPHSDLSNKLQIGVAEEFSTTLGVFLGLCGFILQFQGLRGMNWSASIAQLVCIFLMTIWRAWIRRGLIANPIPKSVQENHDMDWLALKVVKGYGNPEGFWLEDELKEQSNERLSWEISIVDKNLASAGKWDFEPSITNAQRAVNARRHLGQLTNWTGRASALSISVADSIEVVMNALYDNSEHTRFTWALKVKIGEINDKPKTVEDIHFMVEKSDKKWKIDATYIEAALSLWLFHIHDAEDDQHKKNKKGTDSDWLRKDKDAKRKIIRLISLGESSNALRRDTKWWIGDMIGQDIRRNGNDRHGTEFSLVGFVNVASGDETSGNPGPSSTDYNNSATATGNPNTTSLVPLTAVSNVSLESSLMQHIFSSFIWAIANDIPAKKFDKDKTSILRGDLFRMNDPETLLSLGLENKVLTGMANAIQQTGLGSLQEVYMCIIPPLFCFQKLPMGAVVEFIRQQTRDQEVLGRWSTAELVYIKLFQECKALGTPPSLYHKATAILIHLFISVSNALQLQETQARRDGIADLRRIKENILKELNPEQELQSQHSSCDYTHNFVKLAKILLQLNQDLWKRLVHGRASDDTTNVHSFFNHNPLFSEILKMDTYKITKISGEDADARDVFGWSPLHYAVVRGNDVVIQTLFRIGVDPNSTDQREWTPLHYAIQATNKKEQAPNEKALESIIWTLLRNGANTEIRGRDGIAPIHRAAVAENSGKITNLLLQAGASVDIQDNSRRTALHWAAYTGSVEAIDNLLQKGAYRGARDDYGRTPLHLAAVVGWDIAVEKLMVAWRVERDSVDRDGRTPLHLAAIKGTAKVVELLLSKNHSEQQNAHKAVIEVPTDNNDCTPLDLAVIFGHESTAKKLLEIYNEHNEKREMVSLGIAIMFRRTGLVKLFVTRVNKTNIETAINSAHDL